MEENRQSDEIDSYLLNQLPKEESNKFEARLNKEKGLKAEFDLQEKLIDGLKAVKEEEDFFAMLATIKQETVTDKEEEFVSEKVVPIKQAKFRRLGVKSIMSIAAAIALFIVAIWVFTLPDSLTGAQLAQKEFKQYDTELFMKWSTTKGYAKVPDETTLAIIKKGTTAYNENDLSIAKQQFELLHERLPTGGMLSSLTNFYLAQIALKNEQYSESITLLEPLTKLEGLPFATSVNWYLALSYIGVKENNKAVESLMQIPETEKEFGEAAKKLSQQLK